MSCPALWLKSLISWTFFRQRRDIKDLVQALVSIEEDAKVIGGVRVAGMAYRLQSMMDSVTYPDELGSLFWSLIPSRILIWIVQLHQAIDRFLEEAQECMPAEVRIPEESRQEHLSNGRENPIGAGAYRPLALP